MPTEHPVEIVRAWHDAVNTQDRERLIALSDPNIELVGPRGSGYGHPLLADWLARAGVAFQPLRVFARDDVVVVAQQATWRDTATGAVTGERAVASRFRVTNGRVAQFARYDSLDTALGEAGLSDADEVE